MKPCDCIDQYSVDNKLFEQGIAFNNTSIVVKPSSVILTVGACTLKIPQKRFKSFAEWYFKDQPPNHTIHSDGKERCTCNGLPHDKACPEYKNLD